MVFRAIFDKIKKGLAQTRSVFSGVAALFRTRGKVDKDFLTSWKNAFTSPTSASPPPARSSTASARRSSTRKSPATWRPSSSSSSTTCSPPRGPTSTGTRPGRRSSWWPASTAPARRPASPSWPTAPERRQEGAGGRLRHLPGGGRRAADHLEPADRLRDRQERAGQRPGQRGPRRLREGQGPELRRADRGHGRPAAHADAI